MACCRLVLWSLPRREDRGGPGFERHHQLGRHRMPPRREVSSESSAGYQSPLPIAEDFAWDDRHIARYGMGQDEP
jgi:hypothetical protein